MADDDAAPEGELTETSAAEEQSGAAEPESAAQEASTGSDSTLADEPAENADEATEETVGGESDQTLAEPRSRRCRPCVWRRSPAWFWYWLWAG